jgi:protein-L-isoaspartate(D-aspartate) O-methyltransferase
MAVHALLAVTLALGIVMDGCEAQSNGMAHLSSEAAKQAERNRMVDEQIIAGGIRNAKVIEAMRRVPRHRFVPDSYVADAYADGALPIGYGQTISQPIVVASMTEALELTGSEKVLEVGTGSGYQAAILAELVQKVYTIEIVEPLAREAAAVLAELGYRNVVSRTGDGYNGWPEEAPFDAIIVTAAPDHVPQPLLDQLAVSGEMILPVGKLLQSLILYRRTPTGYEEAVLDSVRFVPLVHEGPSEPAGNPSGRMK